MSDLSSPQPTPVFDDSAQLLDELNRRLGEQYGTGEPPVDEPTEPPVDEVGVEVDGEVEGGEVADPPPSAASPPPSPPPTDPADPTEIPLDDLAGQAILPPGSPPTAASVAGEVEVDSPPPPSPVPPTFTDPSAPIDTNAVFENLYGRPVQRGEFMEMLTLVDRLQSLPMDRQNMIVEIMEGRDPAPTSTAPSPAAPAAAPSVPSVPQVDEYGDPIPVDPRYSQIEAQLAETQQFIRQQQEQQARQQQQFVQQQMSAGAQDFASAPPAPLSSEEFTALELRTQQAGIFPMLLQNHNGDARAAWAEALNTTFWTTPAYRDRATTAQSQQVQQSAADTHARQVAASAISPVTTAASATPNVPLDKAGHQAAALAAAREMFNRAKQTTS